MPDVRGRQTCGLPLDRTMRDPRNTKNEGSSGDVYENKQGQVSGVRCQMLGGGKPAVFRSIARCGTPETPKMKVHPGMSMKTNKGRFQVSGARCYGAANLRSSARSHDAGSRNTKNEGSSGDVYGNKQKQVSGVRCQMSGGGKRAVFRLITGWGTRVSGVAGTQLYIALKGPSA